MTQENEQIHHKIAKRVEDVSMTAGIVAGVASAGAVLAAPTGLSALGVSLGIISAPLIVTAAPIIGIAATVAGTISGGAYFYAKWKDRQNSDDINQLSEKQLKDIEMLEQAYEQGFLSEEDFNSRIEKIIQR
ncbi:MAG: hypothetical protein WAX77_03345 [Methylococcaceae bacterium]